MRLSRPHPRRLPETIVPLIDVVFFLLVFFMLIGRMDATAPFAIDPPRAAAGTDLPGGGATVAIGAGGAMALDGVAMPRAEIVAAISERLTGEAALRVRINADGALDLRHVLPLVGDLAQAGAADVVLVVTPGPPR